MNLFISIFKMSPFLKIFSSSFLIIAVIGVFNFIVDPYGIYNTVHITGFNSPKSEAQNYEKLVKAYLVADIKPDAIAMGTSRVGYGIDPESKYWSGDGTKFNLSIGAGSVYITRRFLEHAIAIHVPDKLIMGLDFFAFNAKNKIASDYSDALLAIDKKGDFNKSYKWHILLSSILSYSATKTSINTIKKSNDKRIDAIDPNTGMRLYAINGKAYRADELVDIAANDVLPDTHKTFLATEKYFMREWYFSGDRKEYSFEDKAVGNSTFGEFKKIVKLCKDNNINVYFYISPVHARLQEAISVTGLWPLYEQWKKELVWLLEDEYASEQYSLWDFSGYNGMTSVDVRNGRMRTYVDPSHYSPVIGDMILSRMFDGDLTGIPSDFGRRLNGSSLDNVLGAIRQEQVRYKDKHTDDVMEIENAAASLNLGIDNVVILGGERPSGAKLVRQH